MNVGEPRVFQQSNPFLIYPCIDLLKVNIVVRSEALETFYGKNVGRLPNNTPENLYQEPFVSQDQLIRHVSLNFDSRAISDSEMLQISKKFFSGDCSHYTATERRKYVHLEREYALLDSREDDASLMANMPIKTIHVNFTNCFCPGHYCRLVEDACDSIGRRLALPRRIINAHTEAELEHSGTVVVKAVGLLEKEMLGFHKSSNSNVDFLL